MFLKKPRTSTSSRPWGLPFRTAAAGEGNGGGSSTSHPDRLFPRARDLEIASPRQQCRRRRRPRPVAHTCPPLSAPPRQPCAPANPCNPGTKCKACRKGKKTLNKQTNRPTAVPRPEPCFHSATENKTSPPLPPPRAHCHLRLEVKQTGQFKCFGWSLNKRMVCSCSSISPNFPVPHS